MWFDAPQYLPNRSLELDKIWKKYFLYIKLQIATKMEIIEFVCLYYWVWSQKSSILIWILGCVFKPCKLDDRLQKKVHIKRTWKDIWDSKSNKHYEIQPAIGECISSFKKIRYGCSFFFIFYFYIPNPYITYTFHILTSSLRWISPIMQEMSNTCYMSMLYIIYTDKCQSYLKKISSCKQYKKLIQNIK